MDSTVYDNNLGVGGSHVKGRLRRSLKFTGLLLLAGSADRENEFAVTPTEHLPP